MTAACEQCQWSRTVAMFNDYYSPMDQTDRYAKIHREKEGHDSFERSVEAAQNVDIDVTIEAR